MPKHSKRYNALLSRVKEGDLVPLAEAVRQLKTFNSTKFDQTVEVSTNLGIDPKQSDQNVRGAVALPNGIGKTVRVAVFAQGDNADADGYGDAILDMQPENGRANGTGQALQGREKRLIHNEELQVFLMAAQ